MCAPAGYGKTTLLAEWALAENERGDSVAWLSLVESDDQLFQFWSALLAAISVTQAAQDRGDFDRLSPPQHGVEPRFIEILIEAIASTPGLRWLVLDDVQVLRDPEVMASLDLFLAGLPAGFGVVLMCRSDPSLNLNRLRLLGQLTELRAEGLAFTDAEAAQLLTESSIGIDPTDLHRLVALTEGWVAGLRLAMVSLAASDDAAGFISSFASNERAVADYLFAEVLNHLPPAMIDFLVSTSVPQQLCGALAAQLSGVDDAGEILDQLNRANALVMQTGDPRWFRYHSLLRGYLVAAAERRDAAEVRRQHQMAARWFDDHGMPDLALGHAAACGNDALLVEMLEAHGLRLLLAGRGTLVRDIVDATRPAVRAGLVAATVGALACLDVGDVLGADGYLDLAEQARTEVAERRVAALHDSAYVRRATLGGDPAAALTRTGILEWRVTGDPDVNLIVLAYRGPARARGTDRTGAIEDLTQALRLARERGYDEFVLSLLSQLAWTASGLCDFVAMRRWSGQAIAAATPQGRQDSPRLTYAYTIAALESFATDDLPALEWHAQRAISSLAGNMPAEAEVGARSMLLLSRIESTDGVPRRAAAMELRGLWQSPMAPQVAPSMMAWAALSQVRIALSLGELQWAAEVTQWAAEHLNASAEALNGTGCAGRLSWPGE